MSESNKTESKLNLYLQIATIVLVVVGFVVNHYSQKWLIDHKAATEKKEPSIFGTATHFFFSEEAIVNQEVKLHRVNFYEKNKFVGETIKINNRLINFPVLISTRIENRGNAKADNVNISIHSPANSVLHGSFEIIETPYSDCRIQNNSKYVRVNVQCPTLKQGESRTFNVLWLPNFMTKQTENYRLEEKQIGSINANDLIEVDVVCDNGAKAIILEGSIPIYPDKS